jgi:hypothetical protein
VASKSPESFLAICFYSLAIVSAKEGAVRPFGFWVALFLQHNHFDVAPTGQVIHAQAGACQPQIIPLAPNGSDRDRFRHLAIGADRAFAIFRGEEYAQQPVWWTVVEYTWFGHLRDLGLSKHVSTVVAVVANESCDAPRIPWDEPN